MGGVRDEDGCKTFLSSGGQRTVDAANFELTTFLGAGGPRHEPSRTPPRTSQLITLELQQR
jgi:hypothetical protein